jgi:hypothetical protein
MHGVMVALALVGWVSPQAARANEEPAVIEARALTVPTMTVGGGAMATSASLAAMADREARMAPGVCATQDGRLPDNVRVEAAFQPRIQEMLERSSSFRAQCRQLAAAPWMHIAVRQGPYFLDRHGIRAYSVIQRPQPRLFIVVVTLQASADPALWVAHEFEHLLEQLEEVDVRRQADTRRDAWHTRQGMVETGRAVRAGLRILNEVREERDNLVE